MTTKNEIIKGMKSAMEFYRELGFEYLPVKTADLSLHMNSVAEKKTGYNSAPASSSDKEGMLKLLREEIGDCKRCGLCEGRKNIVFGEGSADARLMFIGDGPGRDEDIQARPFVGEAGQILNSLIDKRGWKRGDVYLANIVKCILPDDRAPEADEIAACMPFIQKQIEIIKPKVIMSLGNVATQSLLMIKMPISKARGTFFSYNDIAVMPTFHPAYFLRNPKEKIRTWEDSAKVMKKLNA